MGGMDITPGNNNAALMGVNAGQNQIGGHGVNIGNANPMRESGGILDGLKKLFSKIGNAIASIFRPDPEKVQMRAAENIGKGMKGVIAELGGGTFSQKTIDNCYNMIKNAKKIDPDAPLGTLREMIKEAVAQMDDNEFAELKDIDFAAANKIGHNFIDEATERTVIFQESLNNTGFSGGDRQETIDAGEQRKREISTIFTAFRMAITERENQI